MGDDPKKGKETKFNKDNYGSNRDCMNLAEKRAEKKYRKEAF